MVSMRISSVACALVIGLVAFQLIASIEGRGGAAPSLSNSGGGSWQYYREIIISEKSGTTLKNYQLLVQLSSDNFTTNAQISGADIRFTDAEENELSYWIESWDAIGKSARIWVKVPNIPGRGSMSIRMYYGNPNASSSSSGNKTFIFFDDFNENDFAANWEMHAISYNFSPVGLIILYDYLPTGLNVSEVDGQLIMSGGTMENSNYGKEVRTKTNFKTPLIYEIDRVSMKPLGDGMFGFIHLYQDDNNWVSYGGGINFEKKGNKIGRVSTIRNSSMYSQDVNNNTDDYGFHVFTTVHDGTFVNFYIDNVSQVAQEASTLNYVKPGISSWLGSNVSNIDIRFDNARIRQYATKEPDIILSSPMPVPTPAPTPAPPPAPLLTVSPDPFSIDGGTITAGESSSRMFSISNVGGGDLTWNVNVEQPWLAVEPASGTKNGTVIIKINTSGLSPGNNSGIINVTSNGGTKNGVIHIETIPPFIPPPPPTSPRLLEIIGGILLFVGLVLTVFSALKKDVTIEWGISERKVKYVGGVGFLFIVMGVYVLLKSAGLI